MTTRNERTRALLFAETFMKGLVAGDYKRVPKEVREAARRVLRHYPTVPELLIIAEAEERGAAPPLSIPLLSERDLQTEIAERTAKFLKPENAQAAPFHDAS